MTIEKKLTTIAENQQSVFEAGKTVGGDAERQAFWNGVQDYGNRTNYQRAFFMWNSDGIRPLYDIKPTDCSYMFYNTNNGEKYDLAARFDELGIVFDTSNSTVFSWMFFSARLIEHIPIINTSSANAVNQTFYGTNAHTIDRLILKEDGSQTFDTPFASCANLVNLTVEGVIGQDGFDVSQCKSLSHDSLMSIINALMDYSGTGITKTVTLGATNRNKLTADELEIAYKKEWTVK